MNSTFVAPLYDDPVLAQDRARAGNMGTPWLLVMVSVFVAAALWFTGKGQLLRMAIPAMATLTAIAFYLTQPVLYVQYALWVWFLTPLARRIVDWRFDYAEPNLVLITPLLVSAVAVLSLVVPSKSGRGRIPAAFVLCGGAIAYGFIVGMVLHPSAETVYGLFNWFCPMLLGLLLFLNWQQYEEYRSAICKTFLCAALVLGLYGIYQYFSPPAWDRYWLENVMVGGQNESFGQPEAFQIRVWSTSNSPGPFANVMMAALLVICVLRSSWKLPAVVAGYLSLLLSLVRTTWLSWMIGLFVLLKKSQPRVIAGVLALLILMGACLLPFANDPRLASVLGDRAKTLSDLGHDESFGARLDMYRVLALDVVDHPFGYGLSNKTTSQDMAIDSGILSMLFSLGWLGSLLFAAGAASLLLKDGAGNKQPDPFLVVCRAVIIAFFAQLIGGNIFIGINGALFWLFAGASLAGLSWNSLQADRAFEMGVVLPEGN